ncbi:hypothetical protein [Candidatus Solirubrobacter pratensis]|uniref:hypothetical protein n=1 Tax=Candidatus Solirubrobacter pratensis TaxID=1298857 RepID=UPI0003F8C560|nr:hypothetical protein [Candidatus Solirubrobacter pratensis]
MPQHAPVRRRATPLHHRRVSGPARPRPVTAGVALPAPRRGRTGVFERIRALPDQRVVDRLLRGRLCIWVIGVMLGGIVAMQVSLLRLNAGISRAVLTASTLESQNSDLESAIASSTSADRLRVAAADDGMIDPPAGDTPFLHARPGIDARLAVKRMTPPSDAAIGVMNNRGKAVATVTAQTGAPAASTTSTASPAATPTPTAVQSAATPVPTATPVVTPVQTAVPGTGAAMAPQG